MLDYDGIDPSATDEQLACQAQAGCARSFEELVARFQVPLLHFLRHRGAAGEAEDLVQDTMVRAYENLHRYRPKWKFSTWLFTIARRLNINHHRRQRRVPRQCANDLCDNEEIRLESVPSGWSQPQQVAMEAEQRERIWDLAAKVLTADQNTAIWLHYVEGLPVADIAHVLGRSRVSVKAMMFRARKKLLPLVREWEPEGCETGSSQTKEVMKKITEEPGRQPLLSPAKGVSYV